MKFGIILIDGCLKNEFCHQMNGEQKIFVADSLEDAEKSIRERVRLCGPHYAIKPITSTMCKALRKDMNAKWKEEYQ